MAGTPEEMRDMKKWYGDAKDYWEVRAIIFIFEDQMVFYIKKVIQFQCN